MTGIDLNPAIDAAARYKFELYQQWLRATPTHDKEAHTLCDWTDVPPARKDAYRSACAPIVEGAYREIAAQTWDQAAEYYGVGSADVREGKQDNPYRGEA